MGQRRARLTSRADPVTIAGSGSAHSLAVRDEDGIAVGMCSCGALFGPHCDDGALGYEWTGASVVQADHRVHVAWMDVQPF